MNFKLYLQGQEFHNVSQNKNHVNCKLCPWYNIYDEIDLEKSISSKISVSLIPEISTWDQQIKAILD